MARYLLSNNQQWTNEKIHEAMHRGSELWVRLNPSVSVFIVYFTSWVDRDGLLHFREDIYGHDKRMAGHLFQ